MAKANKYPRYMVMVHREAREVGPRQIASMPRCYLGLERRENMPDFAPAWDGWRGVKVGTLRQVLDWARERHGEEVAQSFMDDAVEHWRDQALIALPSTPAPSAA